MAIVIPGKTDCPLCGAVLGEADDIVAFPHFIHDSAHSLWRFSDSAMHRACFVGWDQAEQFRQKFGKVWPTLSPGSPRKMLPDGVIVDC